MNRIGLLFTVFGIVCLAAKLAAEEPTLVYKSQFDKSVETAIWSKSSIVRSPAGGKSLLGEFSGYGSTALRLSKIPEHRYLRFKAKLHMIRTLEGNNSKGTSDYWTAVVHGKGALMVTTFANSQAKESGKMQSWPDEYPLANPPTTGASQINSLGFTTEKRKGPVIDATYEIAMSFPHTAADLKLQLGSSLSHDPLDESWALSDVVVEAIGQADPLGEKDLQKLLEDLAGKDAVKAHKAVWALVEQGDIGVKYVDKQLGAKANGSQKEFEKLITALDSEAFVDRQQAHAELRKKAQSFRSLIIARLAKGKLKPTAKAALRAALRQTRDDVLASRVARLMRVSAFEPGWAQQQQKREVKLANSTAKDDGSYRLQARHAEISSKANWPAFKYSQDLMEDLNGPGISLGWKISGIKPGKYQVLLEYACNRAEARIEIRVGETEKLEHTVEETGGWFNPKPFPVGEITVAEDVKDLTLSLQTVDKGAFINPAALVLRPAK